MTWLEECYQERFKPGVLLRPVLDRALSENEGE